MNFSPFGKPLGFEIKTKEENKVSFTELGMTLGFKSENKGQTQGEFQ